MNIITVGYQGLTIEAFIDNLKLEGVKRVVDVRRNAISRWKPDFSKTKLTAALNKAGIDYVHERWFGIDSKVRKSFGDNIVGLFEDYLENLKIYMHDFYDESNLKKLVAESDKIKTAFMCFERNPEECHRSVLLDEIKKIEKKKEVTDEC